MKITEGHLKFCTTDTQRRAIESVIQHGTVAGAARALGIKAQSLDGTVARVTVKAANQGYDPENFRDHVMPAGQVISGYSDLVRYPADDPMGRIIGWIKSNRSKVDQLNQAVTVLDALAADIPREPPAVYVGNPMDRHHFSVIPVGDPHIGLRTWSKEVGTDWDVSIALRVYGRVFRRLLERTPDTEVCVLFNSGDFFHADNMAGETSRSGHKLDLDGRPGYWLDAGVIIIKKLIDMCLHKYKEVHFINTPGNHDDLLGRALGSFLPVLYQDEPRFSIQKGDDSFQYFERGKVALGFCHGHTCKLPSLPGKMASDQSDMWGRTKYRHWFTGHVHHNAWMQWKEHPGCTVESIGIIPPKDAYAHGAAYGAGRGTQLVIMDDRGNMPPDRYTETVQAND